MDKPLRVLLVEDSEDDALLLLRQLRHGGYEPVYERVDTPEEMERALEEADERGEPWDIVISDYSMPRFSGPDALALLKRLGYEDIPFIVVSGKIGEETAVEMMRAGAQDYITKENMARLNPAIERELREARVRNSAEAALLQIENRFRRLVEQAADAMFVHDLEGHFADVNRRACESLGYTREELLQMSVPDIETHYTPGSLERLWEEVSSGPPRTFEGLHRRKDGTTFPVEVHLGMFEAEGRPLMIAQARDITERKRAEDTLRESEERFRATFEQAAVGISHVSPDGRWFRVNQKLCEIVGYDREELFGMSFRDITHPDDLGRDLEHMRRMLEGETDTYSVEKRYVRKDGDVIWIELTTSLLRDPYGELKYFISVTEDITPRKRAEEELQRSESSLADAQRMTHIGNWEYDVARDEAYWSDELYRIFGFSPQEFVPTYKTFLDSVHPDDRRLVRREVREALYGAGESSVEHRIVRPDGETRVVSTRYRTVCDSSNRPVKLVGTIQDITERKRAEEELSRLASSPMLNPNPIVEVDGAGELLYFNPAAERLFPDLQRSGTRHPLLAGVKAVDEEIRMSGDQYSVREVRVGNRYYHQVISIPPGSHLLRVYATDITKRRRAEDALRQSEERYRAVIEQSGEGIFLFDVRTKRILEANLAFQEMLGYTSEELVRMKLYDLVPHDPEGIDRNVERALEQRHILVGERSYRRKDGSTVNVEVSGSIISYGGKEVVCSVVRDITERKWAERALQEIREAERTRIARDLHDGVLQDLTYASAEAQVVRVISEEQETGKRLDQVIEALQRAGRELRGAVYNLRSGEEHDRPLPRLLESLVEQSRRMAPGCEIRLEIEEDFPAASLGTRGAEILRVVQEALTNSRRHSGATHILVALRMEGDKLVAEVADDGRGFGPDTAMGVGLRSMQERAAALGAALEVESEPGKGTRARLYVPS